ncbi:MAG: glycosyltransferase [Candidatus Omnitrophica bacterium]|nr:glycosyltransferase [Candidatus Omnitrophota bacterium]
MRINVLFDFFDGPFGGANQFLKALKRFFESERIYEADISSSDVIIFSSFHNAAKLVKTKLRYPEKIFIHRVDGPIRLYNNFNDRRDYVVNVLNELISDGTVFQSKWSQEMNYTLGFHKNGHHVAIMNAPDPDIFNLNGKEPYSKNRKIRLIASSWSDNQNKGFKAYQWLDRNLDFNKYEMVFVGRSPIKFNRIKHISLMNSAGLASELKRSNIFITASQKDPCSNSLIEALHCGLPAVVLNDGGHSEIIGSGGELFNKVEEVPFLIEKISNNYNFYAGNIKLPGIEEIGTKYYQFINEVYERKKKISPAVKRLSAGGCLRIFKEVSMWEIDKTLGYRPRNLGANERK